ncbi:hypothetical protein pipiens_009766 [Culex pipiens pipiens]|uniref:Uncharacterized protein n=2 Tax=Culex pipiens pipiens TaxID=38569 RepID=A0ABD1DCN4_CULPP
MGLISNAKYHHYSGWAEDDLAAQVDRGPSARIVLSYDKDYVIQCKFCLLARIMNEMRGYRKNTVVIDFGPVPKKPTITQIRKFAFEQLKLDITQIRNLQLSMTKSFVYIEMSPEISAEELVAEYDMKLTMTSEDGVQTQIPLHTADGATEVKIHDLPPYMPTQIIVQHLAEFGEILSITDELWKEHFPGVPTGTRVVRMRIRKPIPSYVNIGDEVGYVRYRNQRPTCRHCSRYLHVGQKCSDVKKAITGSVNSRLTLADIVSGVNPSAEEKQNTETLPAPPPLMPRPSLPIETLNEEQLLADEEVPELPEVVPEQDSKEDSTFPELDENYEISSDEDAKMQTEEAESEADSAEDSTAGKKRPARSKPQKKSKRLSGSKSKSGSSK